jgi:protein TonB
MIAMSYSRFLDPGTAGDGPLGRLRAKLGPLALIVVAHALLFYAIYSGLLHRVVKHALPREVYVSFVSPPPPAPAPPVAPPTVQLSAPPPVVTPPPPAIAIAPSERAITMPPPAAAPAQKAASAPLLAAAPAVPAPSAGPRTITSGVQYLQAPQPVYPPMSRRMGEQGKVVLRVLVSEKGKPDQVLVQTSSGFARLDEAGRQAALRALFKPHLEDGRPVAVFVIVPLNFQLAS